MTLEELRKWFVTRASRRIGVEFKDLSIALKGMEYVLAKVEEKKALHIMDLGAGFSTLSLRMFTPVTRSFDQDTDWCAVTQFYTADHDKSWVEFVAELLKQKKCQNEHCYDMATMRKMKFDNPMDVILIDHGPAMSTRVDDLPWIVGNLAQDGILLLDDFRKTNNFQSTCVNVLKKLGFTCIVEPESRSSNNRAIGIARRA